MARDSESVEGANDDARRAGEAVTTALALGMVAAAVAIAAWAAQGSGKRLVLALVIFAFGVGSINPLIEAVVFGVMPIADVPLTMAWQLLLVGVTALIATAAW